MTSDAAAHRRAVGQLVLAALGWSLGGLLIKAVPWPPLAVASARGAIAAAFLLLTSRGLRWRVGWAIWPPAMAYAACTLTFVTATKLTTAANAILLQYTAPVWVAMLGAWWLGERATRADWWTIAVGLAGMTLFLADGLETGNLTGDLVALFSGLAFAAMTVLIRRRSQSSTEAIILGNVLACVVGLPVLLNAPPLTPIGWGALLTLGVFQLGVSYWLYARAIRHVTALEAVLIPILEPILNPLWVLLLMNERPQPLALLGGFMVVAAVTVRSLHALRRPAPAAPGRVTEPSRR